MGGLVKPQLGFLFLEIECFLVFFVLFSWSDQSEFFSDSWILFNLTRPRKVQVYSLISAEFTFTPWSMDLFIRVQFQLHVEHTVLQPFRHIEIIVHIAISVLPGNYLHLSQVKLVRVKTQNNIETMSQS